MYVLRRGRIYYFPPMYMPPYGSTHYYLTYGSMQSLSKIPHDNEQNLEEILEQPPETREGPDFDPRRPYSTAKIEILFEVWVTTSKDLVMRKPTNKYGFLGQSDCNIQR